MLPEDAENPIAACKAKILRLHERQGEPEGGEGVQIVTAAQTV